MADTFTTYARPDRALRAAAASAGRSRETSRNGAIELHSCTSRSSSGLTSPTVWVQELFVWTSGSRPPASTAVPARCASSDAWPAVSASAVIDAAL